MSNYSALKTDINNNIYENNTQQITGTILNTVLKDMVNTLGAGYQFAGCAYLDLNPGAPDAKVFYLAGEGLYTNFDNIQVPAGKLGILKWDTRWHLETIEGLGGGGANLTGYISVASTDNLPDVGQPTIGYLCGTNLYLYVGEGGDTKDGKYKNCGSFRGPEGVGITEIEQVEQSTENGGRNTIRIHLSNGTSYDVYTRNGTTSTGLFPTLADLQAAHPTPVVGQYAFVGAGFPADIYVCQTAGTWTDSGADYDGDNVDLTNYATKAELAQLEHKVDGYSGLGDVINKGIDALGKWYSTNGASCYLVPVQVNDTIVILGNANYKSRFSILTSNDTSGTTPDYGSATVDGVATTFTKYIDFTKNTTKTIVVTNGTYLYVTKVYNNLDYLPQSIKINGNEIMFVPGLIQKVDALKTSVVGINAEITGVKGRQDVQAADIESLAFRENATSNIYEFGSEILTHSAMAINSSTGAENTASVASAWSSSNFIKVSAGMTVEVFLSVTGGDSGGAFYSDVNVGSFVSGFLATSSAESHQTITIPPGVNYMRLSRLTEHTGTSLILTTAVKAGAIQSLERKVEGVLDIFKTDSLDAIDTITKSQDTEHLNGTKTVVFDRYETADGTNIDIKFNTPEIRPFVVSMWCKLADEEDEAVVTPKCLTSDNYNIANPIYQPSVIKNTRWAIRQFVLPPFLLPNGIVRLEVTGNLVIRDIRISKYEPKPNAGYRGILFHSHLGYMSGRNTEFSFFLSAMMGYDSCIANMRPTLDGVLVCAHDDAFLDVNGNLHNISEMNYADIEAIYSSEDNSKTYANKYWNLLGEKHLVSCEEFLDICRKTGMRPQFSVHADCDWNKVKNMLMRSGFFGKDLATIKAPSLLTLAAAYAVLGENVRYVWNNAYSAEAVATFAQSLGNATKIYELTSTGGASVNSEDIDVIRAAGLIPSLFDYTGSSSAVYQSWIDAGVIEFTTDCFVNYGCLW